MLLSNCLSHCHVASIWDYFLSRVPKTLPLPFLIQQMSFISVLVYICSKRNKFPWTGVKPKTTLKQIQCLCLSRAEINPRVLWLLTWKPAASSGLTGLCASSFSSPSRTREKWFDPKPELLTTAGQTVTPWPLSEVSVAHSEVSWSSWKVQRQVWIAAETVRTKHIIFNSGSHGWCSTKVKTWRHLSSGTFSVWTCSEAAEPITWCCRRQGFLMIQQS